MECKPIERLPLDPADRPLHDPVGEGVAQFLLELISGINVTLNYARDGEWLETNFAADLQTAVANREGPPGWWTQLIVNLNNVGAAAYGSDRHVRRDLPAVVANAPEIALAVAGRLALDGGFDGKELAAPMQRGLADSVAAGLLADELCRRGTGLDSDATHALVSACLDHFDGLAATRIEGSAVTHGVVIGPESEVSSTPFRYPVDFTQKRVPLVFDGDRSVLVLSPMGLASREITRSNLTRSVAFPNDIQTFDEHLAGHGGLVGLVAGECSGVGLYLHADGGIWCFVENEIMLVKRNSVWRAFPMTAFIEGMATLGRGVGGGVAARAAILLALQGHGGVICVVDHAVPVDVPDKDRIDPLRRSEAGSFKEDAVHAVVDVQDIDARDLARLAAIDGATVVSSEGHLLAYASIVKSDAAQDEGARTTAARYLSHSALVVIKVSEDGPITVFEEGEKLVTLLGTG